MLLKPQVEDIKRFIKSQGDYALKALKSSPSFTYKDDKFDIVTEIDRKLEKNFYKYLIKNFPDFGFFGEEFEGLRSKKEFVWYLDPIDGTKYYARGVSLWAISLALSYKDKIILAFVYSPSTSEFFFANKNGSFLNNKKIKAISKTSIEQTQVFLYLKDYRNSGELINKITEHTSRLRIFGIDSLSLCWIANGFPGVFVKFYEYDNQKHLVDFSAGGFIAEQAGCKVEHLKCNEKTNLVLVGNPGVVDKIGRMILV